MFCTINVCLPKKCQNQFILFLRYKSKLLMSLVKKIIFVRFLNFIKYFEKSLLFNALRVNFSTDSKTKLKPVIVLFFFSQKRIPKNLVEPSELRSIYYLQFKNIHLRFNFYFLKIVQDDSSELYSNVEFWLWVTN